MQSIGVALKKDHIVMASLREGLRDIILDDYRIVPLGDAGEHTRADAIVHALEQFCSARNGGRNVYVALPRDSVLIRFVSLPLAVEESLRTTLEYEIDRHIPFKPDDVYFDYHVVKRLPELGLMRVLLVAAKKDLIDHHLHLFNKADILVRGIEVTTSALYNFATRKAPSGAHGNLLPLVQQPAVKDFVEKYFPKISQRIPGVFAAPDDAPPKALDLLAEYMSATTCEVLALDGDELCCTTTCAVSASDDAPAAVRTLLDTARRALAGLPQAPTAETGLRLTLSGRELDPAICESAETYEPSRVSILSDMPVKPGRHRPEALSAAAPQLAVPIALALKGIRPPKMDINFIPPATRPKRKRSKRKFIAAGVSALVVLSSSGLVAQSLWKMNLRHTILTEQLRELRREVQNIEGLLSEVAGIDNIAAAIEGIRRNDISKLILLEEITELMPLDSWLTEFVYSADAREIKLSGFSDSASLLIVLLEESRLLENVRFTSPITADRRTGKERFRLEMKISAGEQ